MQTIRQNFPEELLRIDLEPLRIRVTEYGNAQRVVWLVKWVLVVPQAVGVDADKSAAFLLIQALSADLVSGFSAASLLQNNQGQIEIPFLLTGTLPNVSAKPEPDFVQKILQKALLEKGLDLFGKKGSSLDDLKKEGLKKLFDFGKKKKRPAAPADTASAP